MCNFAVLQVRTFSSVKTGKMQILSFNSGVVKPAKLVKSTKTRVRDTVQLSEFRGFPLLALMLFTVGLLHNIL